PDVITAAGKSGDAAGVITAAVEGEGGLALLRLLGAVGHDGDVASGRAGGAGDGAADGDGLLPMHDAGGRGVEGDGRRGELDVAPVVDELGGVYAAQAGGKVISGGSVVVGVAVAADLAFEDAVDGDGIASRDAVDAGRVAGH